MTQSATVLVVDASPITLLGTAGVLDSIGYVCYCARNHAAAMQVPAQAELDAVVIDTGDDPDASLDLVMALREATGNTQLPAVLLASGIWAGLEKRCEAMPAARCLFKPVDPNVLGDVVERLLLMPQVESVHRRRGTRPTRPGWVNL
jgi:CheY-like chemotaxis protein